MNVRQNRSCVLVVVSLILGLMVACSPTPTPPPTAAPTVAPATSSVPTKAEARTAATPTKALVAGDRTLIVYTNSGAEGRGDWLKERAAKDGFQIEYLQLGAGDLTNRLMAEKNNQIADLVYGLNAVGYEKLKQQNLLLKYEPAWAKQVDMTYGDKDGYYYPIVVQPLILAYNPKFISKDAAPKDWTDLAKPEFKDKYTILDLGGGTAQTILAGILVRYADPKGQYGISDQGWSVVKSFIQNGHIAATGEDYWGNAISGSRPMFEMWGSGLLQNEKDRKVDFAFMTPAIGEPFVVEQVAIFANSKKIDLAKQFVDWFGSAKIQSEWSAKFGSTPAQPEALKNASEDVQAMMAAVKPQKIDWAFVAANLDKWVEKCQLEFVK